MSIIAILSAVCPYLALETCRQWRLSNKTVNLMRNGKMPTVTIEQAQRNFCKVCLLSFSFLITPIYLLANFLLELAFVFDFQAVKLGLMKILSKMGISLLSRFVTQLFRCIHEFHCLI
jgi:glutamate synthase (ferredoxin)